MSYKLINQSITNRQDVVVKRLSDSAFIPFDDNNMDYVEYKEWLAAGNTPAAAD